MEGVLPPPPQLPVCFLSPAQIAGDDWDILTDFFCSEDGDIATYFSWSTPPRRDPATLEIREVFMVQDVRTDREVQTEEPARHASGIEVSPLCSGLMPPPIGFSYNQIATKVLEWDRLNTDEVVGHLLVESGEMETETDRCQLEVIMASCIVGMHTFACGLQDRYEQMIPSPMFASAQALVGGLVDEAILRSFNNVEIVYQLPLHSQIEEDSVGWSTGEE